MEPLTWVMMNRVLLEKVVFDPPKQHEDTVCYVSDLHGTFQRDALEE